jgi:hypothetical protein
MERSWARLSFLSTASPAILGFGVFEVDLRACEPRKQGVLPAEDVRTSGHSGHTATLLPSSKVLIAGGGNYIAELFDPGTGTFSLTGSMLVPRTFHTATLLPSGQVVVTGSLEQVSLTGSTCRGGPLGSAELYH